MTSQHSLFLLMERLAAELPFMESPHSLGSSGKGSHPSMAFTHQVTYVCLHICATDISVPMGRIPNEQENILGVRNKLGMTLISIAGTRQGWNNFSNTLSSLVKYLGLYFHSIRKKWWKVFKPRETKPLICAQISSRPEHIWSLLVLVGLMQTGCLFRPHYFTLLYFVWFWHSVFLPILDQRWEWMSMLIFLEV